MEIKTKNLVLKSTDKDDADLQGLAQGTNILFNMSETRLYPKSMPGEMPFRIEKDGELIGEIRFKTIKWFNRKAELSIMLSEENQNSGYGYEAMLEAMKFGFQKMNLHRIEAEVIAFNKSSIKLVEKLGFVFEGTLREAKYSDGKYYDIYRYGILKNEFNNKFGNL
jgi:RimJ/RimL family protein N-acetyltransferase